MEEDFFLKLFGEEETSNDSESLKFAEEPFNETFSGAEEFLPLSNNNKFSCREVLALHNASASWKLLIVDDEPDMHTVTLLALRGLKFLGRELEFIHAYSAEQARELLEYSPDIAVILLDVVMETPNAGLELVQHIRHTLKYHFVRIILRTGHPGQVPERHAIVEYEINDYRTKSELTSARLFTSVMSCIRSYNSLVSLESYRCSLERKVNERTKEITDGIRYARRLQDALLPTRQYMQESLREYFVLSKPKDIISGDFYWMCRKNDTVVFLLADCTGHGVPGAFMSLLGISLLNEIINAHIETGNAITITAAEILNRLRDKIKIVLRQKGEYTEAQDGMDMTICVYDMQTKALNYAGAFNSLYLIRNNKHDTNDFKASDSSIQPHQLYKKWHAEHNATLYKLFSDKMTVGMFVREKESFNNFWLTVQPDDTFFMSTDGYADQFGGVRRTRFFSRRFIQLLSTIHNLDMAMQHDVFDQTIEKWRGNNEQIDDITVIGFRL